MRTKLITHLKILLCIFKQMFKKTRQATELIKAMIGPAKAKVELMELCQSRWFGRFEFILIYLFKNLQLVVLGHNLYLKTNECSYLELG